MTKRQRLIDKMTERLEREWRYQVISDDVKQTLLDRTAGDSKGVTHIAVSESVYERLRTLRDRTGWPMKRLASMGLVVLEELLDKAEGLDATSDE